MRKRPEPITFFVDVDLGKRFHRVLIEDRRFRTEFQGDHFPQGADDAEWIPFAAKHGWVSVTHDGKIRLHHRPIIENSNARAIIVIGKRTPEVHAVNFRDTFPSIERFIRKQHGGPYLAKLHHPEATELRKLRPRGSIKFWGDWPDPRGSNR